MVGLVVMILGLALFLGVHTLPAQRELRGRAIAAMGEGGYKAVYALVSVLGIVLIAWGFAHYRAAGMIEHERRSHGLDRYVGGRDPCLDAIHVCRARRVPHGEIRAGQPRPRGYAGARRHGGLRRILS